MRTRPFGISAILLVAAAIVFALVGFGVTIGDLDALEETAFGLALFALSFLVP